MISEEEKLEIGDRIGELAHNEWMKKRKDERGWHNPRDCPHPQPCENCHECMVPWDQLPEQEKKLARSYPNLFLQVLDEMGFEIVKKGD